MSCVSCSMPYRDMNITPWHYLNNPKLGVRLQRQQATIWLKALLHAEPRWLQTALSLVPSRAALTLLNSGLYLLASMLSSWFQLPLI